VLDIDRRHSLCARREDVERVGRKCTQRGEEADRGLLAAGGAGTEGEAKKRDNEQGIAFEGVCSRCAPDLAGIVALTRETGPTAAHCAYLFQANSCNVWMSQEIAMTAIGP
jgi:hypothetical protein